MTTILDKRYFQDARGAGRPIEADSLFRALTWRMLISNSGDATLLLQGGLLIAPIFVMQLPPTYARPWWVIDIVQYHSLTPNLTKGYLDLWSFYSLESLFGKNPLEQTLYVHAYANNQGLVSRNVRIHPLNFTYGKHARHGKRMASEALPAVNSFIKKDKIPIEKLADERTMIADKLAGNTLSADDIRDGYPKKDLSEIYQLAMGRFTLQSEIEKMFGV